MRPVDLRSLVVIIALAAACAGCAAGPSARSVADHDRPVPANVPRAELALQVDLEPARDCEERFDLALYQNRAIDLIAWDADRNRCADRQLSIRYLSRQLNAEQLFERVRELARDVKRLPPAPVSKP